QIDFRFGGFQVDVELLRICNEKINLQSEICHLKSHDRGTDCPASTHTYSQAKLPASARTAAIASAIGSVVSVVARAAMTIETIERPIAPPQKTEANAPRRIAETASS